MLAVQDVALRLGISLGAGLLIGLEREQRKGEGAGREAAGVRTFALVSLAGGMSVALESEAAFVASAIVVGVLVSISYFRSSTEDPGLTTEVALLVTFLLGALALREPLLTAGLAVTVAVILASRSTLHDFARSVLSRQELHDALLLAAAALVVLPLTPDRPVGPLAVLNPRTLWKLVVLVMAIGGAGYVALRALGPRFGLPLAGLASGFVSSAATIGSMGARSRREPSGLGAAVSGAALSTVATVVQMVVVLGTTSVATLRVLALPLALAGAAAVAYGVTFAVAAARQKEEGELPAGRAFDPKAALLFALTVSTVLLCSAAVNRWLGATGVLVAAALAGFADTHSAAISVASLVAAGELGPEAAVVPILAAMTTNTTTKAVLAAMTGGARFALRIVPGLLLVILAAWGGAWLAGLVPSSPGPSVPLISFLSSPFGPIGPLAPPAVRPLW